MGPDAVELRPEKSAKQTGERAKSMEEMRELKKAMSVEVVPDPRLVCHRQ